MIKDSATGKDSVSKTLYVIASIALLVKIMISGVAFGDFTGQTVDFVGLAAVYSVFAATYYGRSKIKQEARNAKFDK